jgi:hypothetical protein
VNAALALESPTGATYRERLDKVKTEKELNDIFADFINIVPLGGRLFGSLNPVRTAGPMQVSIAYARTARRREEVPLSCPQHDPQRSLHAARRDVLRHRAPARLPRRLR